jgi:hypothetical protein
MLKLQSYSQWWLWAETGSPRGLHAASSSQTARRERVIQTASASLDAFQAAVVAINLSFKTFKTFL